MAPVQTVLVRPGQQYPQHPQQGCIYELEAPYWPPAASRCQAIAVAPPDNDAVRFSETITVRIADPAEVAKPGRATCVVVTRGLSGALYRIEVDGGPSSFFVYVTEL